MWVVSIVVTVASAWAANFSEDGEIDLAKAGAYAFLAFLVICPLCAAYWAWASTDDEDSVYYATLRHALGTGALGAVFGSLASLVTYLVVFINISAIFFGESQEDLRTEILDRLGPWTPAGLVALTLAVGVLAALWAHRRVRANLRRA